MTPRRLKEHVLMLAAILLLLLSSLSASSIVNETALAPLKSAQSINFTIYNLTFARNISDCFIKPGGLVDYLDRFTHHAIEHQHIKSMSSAIEYFAKIFQFPFGILYDMVDRLIEFINYLEPHVPTNIYDIPLRGEHKTLSYLASLLVYVLNPVEPSNTSEGGERIAQAGGLAAEVTKPLSVGSEKFVRIMTLDLLACWGRFFEVCKLLFIDLLITRSWAFRAVLLGILFVFGLVPFIYARLYPGTVLNIVTSPSLAPIQIVAHILYNFFSVRLAIMLSIAAIVVLQLGLEHIPDFWNNWIDKLLQTVETTYMYSHAYDHFFIDETNKLQLNNIVATSVFVGDVYLYYIAPIQFLADTARLVVYFAKANSQKMARLKYEFYNSFISSGFARLIKFFVKRKQRLVNLSKLIRGQTDLKDTTSEPDFSMWNVYMENSISIGLMYVGWYHSSPDSPIAGTPRHCPHPESPGAVNMKILLVRYVWSGISTAIWSIPKFALVLEFVIDFLRANFSLRRGLMFVSFAILIWKPLLSWLVAFSKIMWMLVGQVWLVPSTIMKLFLRIVFFSPMTFRWFLAMAITCIVIVKLY